jgi:hypothetical protein
MLSKANEIMSIAQDCKIQTALIQQEAARFEHEVTLQVRHLRDRIDDVRREIVNGMLTCPDGQSLKEFSIDEFSRVRKSAE